MPLDAAGALFFFSGGALTPVSCFLFVAALDAGADLAPSLASAAVFFEGFVTMAVRNEVRKPGACTLSSGPLFPNTGH